MLIPVNSIMVLVLEQVGFSIMLLFSVIFFTFIAILSFLARHGRPWTFTQKRWQGKTEF
jgi:hypothetical protein